MSGIAGLFDLDHNLNNQIPIFKQMIASMKHRGPDDSGMLLYDHLCFMHTSLAIVDPKQGKQPLQSYPYSMIYNGELFNADEIRNHLIHHGVVFETACDSEVVLKAYAYYKEECLQHFKGFFAFAIYDENKEELFLARDPFGIKPLFYSKMNQSLYFASEIKTLLTHPLIHPLLDCDGIHQLAYLGPAHISGTTYFKNIAELKPATYMKIRKGIYEIVTYSQLLSHPHHDSLKQTLQTIHQLVHQSILQQIPTEVTFGSFLSGGLDSSIITAILANALKEQGKTLQTFSIAYEDNEKYFLPNSFQPNSDDSYIQEMVTTFHTHHTKVILTPQNLLDSLYQAVDARDVPGMADVDSALLCACKEVRKNVKVVFSGECADEIFAGYPWFSQPITDTFPWNKNLALRHSFLQSQYQINANEYIQNKILETLQQAPIEENETCENQQIKQMTYLNIRWFMQTLLDRKDRMTMANGLEARIPFCDKEILEYVYSIPWSMKNLNQQEKGMLREAMKGLIPDSILYRKKSPFPKTHHPLYLQILKEELSKLIENEHEPLWKIFRKDKLSQLLTEETSLPWYGQLMTTPQTIAYFLQINYWLKKYKIQIV